MESSSPFLWMWLQYSTVYYSLKCIIAKINNVFTLDIWSNETKSKKWKLEGWIVHDSNCMSGVYNWKLLERKLCEKKVYEWK